MYSTGKRLQETGDLSGALRAGADSGIKRFILFHFVALDLKLFSKLKFFVIQLFFSVGDIITSIPGADLAKAGFNIPIDLYEGKNLKSTIEDRYIQELLTKNEL